MNQNRGCLQKWPGIFLFCFFSLFFSSGVQNLISDIMVAKHVVLRSKTKDWLTRYHNNMERHVLSTCCYFSELANSENSIKRVGLVQSRHHYYHHLIEMQLVLVMIWLKNCSLYLVIEIETRYWLLLNYRWLKKIINSTFFLVKYVKFSVIFTENKVLTLEPNLWIIEKLFHIFFMKYVKFSVIFTGNKALTLELKRLSWSYGSWIYNYLCNQCLSPLMLWVLDTTLCDKVCQWLATGRWFSPDPQVSSTNKADSHDIAEILLKVALNTINLTKHYGISHVTNTSTLTNIQIFSVLMEAVSNVNKIHFCLRFFDGNIF